MRTIIAISGRPGTGKTTLMREFMAGHTWERQSPAKLVETMYCKDLDLHILGKYEDGEVFAGTDKLSMACQPEVTKWLQTTKHNVIYEGDRLTGSKFYDALLDIPDTELYFLLLHADEATLKARYRERGSDQSQTFLDGRATKINNLVANFSYMDYYVIMPNNNKEDQATLLYFINNKVNK